MNCLFAHTECGENIIVYYFFFDLSYKVFENSSIFNHKRTY